MADNISDRLRDYVPVSERIEQFYAKFPDGRIITSIVEHDAENGFIVMRASVYSDRGDVNPVSTGHAFDDRSDGYVNKSSYIENCETSCVGRALALLGFEIKRGIASREEMEKASRFQDSPSGNPECPDCGKTGAVIKGKEEYGGGWLCFKKKGGCGASWGAEGVSAPAANLPIADVAINALREKIKEAMALLNEAGDVPEWTVQRVNEMSREHFGDVAARLGLEPLGQLAEMLSQRLESVRQNAPDPAKDNIIAAIRAGAAEGMIEQYLREKHDGAAIESLTLKQLDRMEAELTVPF